MKLLLVILLIIIIGMIVYIRVSCIGIWHKKNTWIPIVIDKVLGKERIYEKCEWIELSGIFSKKRPSLQPTEEQKTPLTHHKDTSPSFSFDYPRWPEYTITTGEDFIDYSIKSQLEGPTSARIQWNKKFIKATADYWDKQKMNKNNVRYILDPEEKFLDFQLAHQGGTIISFDVSLPGSYLRKKEIINTLIDSFKEETTPEQKPAILFEDTYLEAANAIEKNDIDLLIKSIQQLDVNKVGARDMTLLWYAGVLAKNYIAVTELIKNGANPNQIDGELGSLIDIAVQAEDSKLLESILNAGVSPDTLNSWNTPLLFTAVCLDSRENLNLLIQRGADINLKDKFLGRTALYEAISKQCFDQAIYLINNHHANVNITTSNGVSIAYSVQWNLEREKPETNNFNKLVEIKKLIEKQGIHFPIDGPKK